MKDVIIFILKTVGIGILLLIPTIVIQKWLIKIGAVRDGLFRIIIGIFLVVFIKQLWFSEDSWLFWGALIIIGCILAMNRGDLWDTMQYGLRWWESEKKE
jgi:hypothetical protein